MNPITRIIAVSAAGVLLAGCGGIQNPLSPSTDTPGAPVPTVTYSYAVDRVERLISDAATFLTPTPELTLIGDTDIPCLDPGADGSQFNGQVQPGRSYFLAGLPADRPTSELVAAMAEHWVAQGYRITRDERPQNQTIAAADDADFGMTITVNARGDVALIASSPCVQADTAGQ
ncbi:hypothetical protein [Pseudonocardia abyssalis]|uniref:LppA-like lipoprotein n=1 Tax=Pseudonocardia abyssalis TaxID=2792008 RepID=A0ABS6UZJ1_9PSEU|nr:hypothetical protein [Pseudonocardia abyssalis]MBW0114036.1 hypothetical protein [Pseudonocardia abyssalis]MBW0137677.1 hypothetical protein [Pseudonocardia abyssalis]